MEPKLFAMIVFGIVGFCVLAFLSFSASKIQQSVKNAEEKSRRSTPCRFGSSISRSAFETAAKEAGKNVLGLKQLTVSGTVVHGVGLNPKTNIACHFDLDFNDSGEITGKYWKYCDDPNAGLPDFIGNRVQYALRDQLRIPNFKFEHAIVDKPMTSGSSVASSTIGVAMALIIMILILWLFR